MPRIRIIFTCKLKPLLAYLTSSRVYRAIMYLSLKVLAPTIYASLSTRNNINSLSLEINIIH